MKVILFSHFFSNFFFVYPSKIIESVKLTLESYSSPPTYLTFISYHRTRRLTSVERTKHLVTLKETKNRYSMSRQSHSNWPNEKIESWINIGCTKQKSKLYWQFKHHLLRSISLDNLLFIKNNSTNLMKRKDDLMKTSEHFFLLNTDQYRHHENVLIKFLRDQFCISFQWKTFS